jgi:hypothetical protein
MKEAIGIIAVALGIIGAIPYIRDIFRGKTKPHLFSNIIWAVVTTLAFFGQTAGGAGPGAWTTGVMAIITTVFMVLSIKYGTKDITKTDVFFLVIGLLAIIPWWLTDDPTISVVIATIIDVCGFSPTIRKTINDPGSETLSSWVLNCIRHGLSLFALTQFTTVTYIYPLALFLMNIITVYIIVRGNNKLKHLR